MVRKEEYHKKKKAGKCVCCNKKAIKGYTTCEGHREYKRDYSADSRRKKRTDQFVEKHQPSPAMEFLTTYAWAILVVLAAVLVLAYFGVLNPEKFLPTSYIQCEDDPNSCISIPKFSFLEDNTVNPANGENKYQYCLNHKPMNNETCYLKPRKIETVKHCLEWDNWIHRDNLVVV